NAPAPPSALSSLKLGHDDAEPARCQRQLCSSLYPFAIFSLIIFSTCFAAAVSSGKFFTLVCPWVPFRPNRTVTSLPVVEISQNLSDDPWTNSNRRFVGTFGIDISPFDVSGEVCTSLRIPRYEGNLGTPPSDNS